MSRPNFFILGAPKCGTTSLAAWLSQHPDVFIPPEKELNFFDDDHSYNERMSLAQYERLFAAADAKAIGEASVWYLYSRTAVANILKYQPDARFIVCVRDPVDMAFSLHQQQQFSRWEDLADFREAWEAQEARKHGAPVAAPERSHLYYGDVCKLGEQVERLLAQTDKVHFVRLEVLRADPRRVYQGVLEFLEVPPHDADYGAHNVAKVRRSLFVQKLLQSLFRTKHRLGIRASFGALTKLYQWNTRRSEWKPDPALAAELERYFESDREKLDRLIAGQGAAAQRKWRAISS
ncbi:sulfotransferase family protein [Sphingomonas sp. URHD0057]|uniref:sulfotransferase family protein n=1 Tax=Sphingomonas sp. URHD0057 TaxID=1380389 RepID=UPI00068417DF|nr:sulfotransferase [Sphingomonas sp. URHD0057]